MAPRLVELGLRFVDGLTGRLSLLLRIFGDDDGPLGIVGSLAMFLLAPQWTMRFAGWPGIEPVFFAYQAGIFHMVLAAAYLLDYSLDRLARADDPHAAFFRCWTRKEACVKALGHGVWSAFGPPTPNPRTRRCAGRESSSPTMRRSC